MATKKRLYRSKADKVFGGVLGGIAEYLELDSSILRLLFLALTIFTGFVPGVVFYFLAVLVVPSRNGK